MCVDIFVGSYIRHSVETHMLMQAKTIATFVSLRTAIHTYNVPTENHLFARQRQAGACVVYAAVEQQFFILFFFAAANIYIELFHFIFNFL